MTSEKSKTNKKWVSTKEYSDNYDSIFGKRCFKCNGTKKILVPGLTTDDPAIEVVCGCQKDTSEY